MKSWGIWKDRCNFIHKEKVAPKYLINPLDWIDNFLDAFKRAQPTRHTHQHPLSFKYAIRDSIRDQKIFSLYVDAAFNNSQNAYAVGFVMINPEGIIWGAGFHKI